MNVCLDENRPPQRECLIRSDGPPFYFWLVSLFVVAVVSLHGVLESVRCVGVSLKNIKVCQ